MKHLSLVINVILGVAVAVLFVLHFTDPGIPEEIRAEYEERGEFFPASLDIVYVNFDTLLENYDMFFDLQREFLEKQQKLEGDLSTRSRRYERQVADFQDRVQKGLMTRSQAQQRELELMQVQQELMQMSEQFSIELREEEQVMNRQLQHSIYEFLEEFNRMHNYQYVLSHSFGGPLLYVDKNLDVTREVIEGLNRRYGESRRR